MSEQLKIFESLGIDVFDKAKEFIQEFDGLKIPATDFRFDENNKNHFHYFDAMHDIKGMYDILIEQKEDCEKILMNRNFCNERVFPVGGLHGWGLGLYITESGKLINDVRVYSNTIEEGVKNLVLHKSVGSIADLLPITPVKSTVQNEKTDEKVVYLLKKSGWYEGRKLDITEKVKRLEALGYEVFEQAKLFLEEFDDLKMEQTAPFYYGANKENPRYNSFNVSWFIKALENMPQERRQRTMERRFSAPRADEKTIPIGELHDGYMYLFITESGRIITDITIEGNSIEEGITNLVKNKCVGTFLSNKS